MNANNTIIIIYYLFINGYFLLYQLSYFCDIYDMYYFIFIYEIYFRTPNKSHKTAEKEKNRVSNMSLNEIIV